MHSRACQGPPSFVGPHTGQAAQMVESLLARVENWKGYCICTFGVPLLSGTLRISRTCQSEPAVTSDRWYEVYLFSNIFLACKHRDKRDANGKDLALKGRVFLQSIKSVTELAGRALELTWLGEIGIESFIITFDEQASLTRWHESILDNLPPAARSYANSHYNPLPAYQATHSLLAPFMERCSPVHSSQQPLPPPYSPALLTPPLDEKKSLVEATPCRPSLVSHLSTSTICSDEGDNNNGRQLHEKAPVTESHAEDGRMPARTTPAQRRVRMLLVAFVAVGSTLACIMFHAACCWTGTVGME